MTDMPLSALSDDHSAGESAQTKDDLDACLLGWVRACLENGEQDLDRMIVTAPDTLKAAFGCYDAMADEIEATIQRLWRDMARTRLLSL